MGGFSTAVPGPTNQGFNITPPDPYANLRALAMQGQIAEQKQNIATQQQAMGTTALNQQILQQQLDDQKALVQTFKDGVDPNKPDDIINGIIKNGGSGPTAIKFVQEIANTRKINAQTDIDTLNAQKQREDHYRATVEGITKLPPEQQQPAWNEHRNEILSVDPGAPALYPGNDIAMARANTHGLQSQLIDEEQKRRETQKTTAETTKLNTINAIVQKAQQAQTATGQHPIDTIIPDGVDDGLKAALKGAYDRGLASIDPNTGLSQVSQRIVENAAEFMQARAKATNRDIRAGEAATAAAKATAEIPAKVATEQATAPIKRANAIAEAKALREGDNPALAGVPPAAAQGAVTAATKLDSDYIKAREATESLGKLLDLADQSNVAAGANIPLAGVGAINAINGIKRINSAEIQQYGTAGSLLQKIQGKLGGWVDGQPIPASVRDDIRELQQQLGESAYDAYTQGFNSLNQRTGAKFGPTVPAPNIRKGAGGALPRVATPADVAKLPKGTHFLDPNGIERVRP